MINLSFSSQNIIEYNCSCHIYNDLLFGVYTSSFKSGEIVLVYNNNLFKILKVQPDFLASLEMHIPNFIIYNIKRLFKNKRSHSKGLKETLKGWLAIEHLCVFFNKVAWLLGLKFF